MVSAGDLPPAFLLDRLDADQLELVRRLRRDFIRMQMEHQSAVDEVLTKVEILRREFLHLHRYNPIEHVVSRVKTPASILEKALRRDLDLSLEAIRAGITDIAGVRITCSFISDTERVLEALTAQADLDVVEIKDYIAHPKPNGYRSLHVIVQVPVYLSTGPVPVTVEVQIRTIAMDFWASLDHKIHYKYRGDVPAHLTESLTETATIAAKLDKRMEQLHREVHGEPDDHDGTEVTIEGFNEQLLEQLWRKTRPQHAGLSSDATS